MNLVEHLCLFLVAEILCHGITCLLQSNETEMLTRKFLHARETEQRMNSDLVKIDTKLILDFDKAVSDVDTVFGEISGKLDSVCKTVDGIAHEMDIRTSFHSRWGVEKVKVRELHLATGRMVFLRAPLQLNFSLLYFVLLTNTGVSPNAKPFKKTCVDLSLKSSSLLQYTMEYSFQRGFQVMDERTFVYVTSSYIEMAEYIQKVIDMANTSPPEAESYRQVKHQKCISEG